MTFHVILPVLVNGLGLEVTLVGVEPLLVDLVHALVAVFAVDFESLLVVFKHDLEVV